MPRRCWRGKCRASGGHLLLRHGCTARDFVGQSTDPQRRSSSRASTVTTCTFTTASYGGRRSRCEPRRCATGSSARRSARARYECRPRQPAGACGGHAGRGICGDLPGERRAEIVCDGARRYASCSFCRRRWRRSWAISRWRRGCEGRGGTEWRWPASRLRRSRTAHPQGLLAVRGGGGVSLRILQLSRSAAVQTMWPGEANSAEDRYARVEDATRERRWSCWTRRDAPAPRPWRLGLPPTCTYPPPASPTSSSISAAAGPRRAAAAARSTWG